MNLKAIYWHSNDQTLRVVKTHTKVGALRVVEDLCIVVTDLQKDAFLFGTHIAPAAVVVLQPIELLHNRLSYRNLEDICKLIHMATGIHQENILSGSDYPDQADRMLTSP